MATCRATSKTLLPVWKLGVAMEKKTQTMRNTAAVAERCSTARRSKPARADGLSTTRVVVT